MSLTGATAFSIGGSRISGVMNAQQRFQSQVASDAVSSIEACIEEAVERAIERLLGPYLRRICEPEPAVYTVAQAGVVLQVSEDTVARLVRRGVLHRVPHVGGKVLIPRAAVDELLAGLPSRVQDASAAGTQNVSPLRSASGP
jgi:excisionase family DNA binding protein